LFENHDRPRPQVLRIAGSLLALQGRGKRSVARVRAAIDGAHFRLASIGSIAGARWGRKDDTVALALVVNGISKAHQAYLAAGGLGILVGDGQLPHPGAEAIVEAYYSLAVVKGVHLTLDSQSVVNPAYNRDRGPVEVLGLRLHGQF